MDQLVSEQPEQPAIPGGADPAGGGSYEPQLARALHVLGNIAITVSAVTPAASVFIIAPVAFASYGSATFLAFIAAGVIGVGMAFCYAELGAAYPVTGADYSIVSRILGRESGFLALVLWLALAVFIPSSIALGIGTYLSVVWSANANVLGAGVMVIATLVAIFNIRLNARVTGVFLMIELAAILVVSVLGFAHAHNSVSELFSPHVFAANGHASAASFGVVLSGVAIAIFAYNGYGGAIYFSEETSGASRGIARAVLWSLVITVVAELVPVTATLIGAPSLSALASSSAPMTYLIKSLSGNTLNTIVSLGISVAILNATIAILLEFGRVLYSSARDLAWPGPVNRALASVHPTAHTPWVATAVVGIVGAVLTGLSSVASLVTFTSVLLCVNYALIALSAIVSRITQRGIPRPYRMPLWPLWPIVALVGTVAVFTKQTGHDELITLLIVLGSAAYYVLFLLPRRASHWIMKKPIVTEEDA